MIRNLIVDITSDCNLRCSYCYCKSRYKTDGDNIRRSIEKILLRYDIRDITITGGEPLLEYNFVRELLRALTGRGMKIVIITNGLLLNQRRIDELKRLGARIKISIDGFSGIENEKKPTKGLIRLIRSNKDCLNQLSKVITKDNVDYLYDDFLKLASMGFMDMDIIPQMYTYWNKKKREVMIRGVRKIVRYSLRNNIRTSFMDSVNRNRYYDCDKIRVLPDGDISFCISLNSFRKWGFINNENLNNFEVFKKYRIDFALKEYRKKDWFDEKYLKEFCMIDFLYYSYINRKGYKPIISAIKLFSELNKVTKEEISRFHKQLK